MEGRIPVLSFLLSLLFLAASCSPNITLVLKSNPSFSLFNDYLSRTSVSSEINSRSSLTILAVADTVLQAAINSFSGNGGVIGDVLRYHVLLQYLDESEIRTMTNVTGILMTTLYQTTGRAAGNDGFLNMSVSRTGVIGFGLPSGGGPPKAAFVKTVTTFPYNISIFQVDHVLIPIGVSSNDAGQADIISILRKSAKFNTLVNLLQSTGVASALVSKETGAGITVLAPSDDAFNALPNGALTKLTDAQKVLILEYHVLSKYFPLGSLQTVFNPALSTIASGSDGGAYTLNVSSSKGNVVIDTGISKALIINTLYDQPPVSVFSVDTVLLAPEIFAASPSASPGPSPVGSSVPSLSPSPAELTPVSAPTPVVETPAPYAPASVPALVPEIPPSPSAPASSPPSPLPFSSSPSFSPESAPGPSAHVNAGILSSPLHLFYLFLPFSAWIAML